VPSNSCSTTAPFVARCQHRMLKFSRPGSVIHMTSVQPATWSSRRKEKENVCSVSLNPNHSTPEAGLCVCPLERHLLLFRRLRLACAADARRVSNTHRPCMLARSFQQEPFSDACEWRGCQHWSAHRAIQCTRPTALSMRDCRK
jgi:hypothetical protein